MIKILTSPTCSQCKMAKRILDSKNVKYEEIDIEEGKEIIEKYNVKSIPFFLRGEETYKSLPELLRSFS